MPVARIVSVLVPHPPSPMPSRMMAMIISRGYRVAAGPVSIPRARSKPRIAFPSAAPRDWPGRAPSPRARRSPTRSPRLLECTRRARRSLNSHVFAPAPADACDQAAEIARPPHRPKRTGLSPRRIRRAAKKNRSNSPLLRVGRLDRGFIAGSSAFRPPIASARTSRRAAPAGSAGDVSSPASSPRRAIWRSAKSSGPRQMIASMLAADE